MKLKSGRYRSVSITRARHWISVVLTAALLLTTVAGPITDLDMTIPVNAMTDDGAAPHMGREPNGMADPCCDECDHSGVVRCDNSALCMTACGKLPFQLAAAFGFVPARHASNAVHEPDIGRVDLSPSPLRRPPKAV
jgi:hypothetical protein